MDQNSNSIPGESQAGRDQPVRKSASRQTETEGGQPLPRRVIGRGLRRVSRISTFQWMSAIAHYSVVLCSIPYVGAGATILAVLLTLGFYYSIVRAGKLRAQSLPPASWFQSLVWWPWRFVGSIFFALVTASIGVVFGSCAVFAAYFLILRLGYDHGHSAYLAGWWGFFPACVAGLIVAGCFFFFTVKNFVWVFPDSAR